MNATLSDEGTYQCEATNVYGSDRETISISIQRTPIGE
mgnify:FL=1